MSPKTLSGTTEKPSGYLRHYEDAFATLDAEADVSVLELGVHEGGSLLMWLDYFTGGPIVGVDLNPVTVSDPSGRIHVYQGPQQDTALLTRIARRHAPSGFDLIVDDCAHIGEIAKTSFWHLFTHHLKRGGIYAIEDWGTGYWAGQPCYPDGMRLTKEDGSHAAGMVGFVKSLVDECGITDVTNPEWGNPPQRASKFSKMLVSPGLVLVWKASGLKIGAVETRTGVIPVASQAQSGK